MQKIDREFLSLQLPTCGQYFVIGLQSSLIIGRLPETVLYFLLFAQNNNGYFTVFNTIDYFKKTSYKSFSHQVRGFLHSSAMCVCVMWTPVRRLVVAALWKADLAPLLCAKQNVEFIKMQNNFDEHSLFTKHLRLFACVDSNLKECRGKGEGLCGAKCHWKVIAITGCFYWVFNSFILYFPGFNWWNLEKRSIYKVNLRVSTFLLLISITQYNYINNFIGHQH